MILSMSNFGSEIYLQPWCAEYTIRWFQAVSGSEGVQGQCCPNHICMYMYIKPYMYVYVYKTIYVHTVYYMYPVDIYSIHDTNILPNR